MFNFECEISDSELGAKVKIAHQKHLDYVEEMTPTWQAEGAELRKVREDLNISRHELSQYIGVCDQVIAKFEKGLSVRSRNMLSQSFKTSLELIQLKRNNSVDSIKQK